MYERPEDEPARPRRPSVEAQHVPPPVASRGEPPPFWRRSAIRRIMHGIGAVLTVEAFGVLGYVLMGWGLSDAVFMVWITVSGVGFGEVRPLATLSERLHTMAIITTGIAAVTYTMAGFLQLLTEGEIQRLLGHQRVRRQIETLRDHVIVTGYGRMGSMVCDELAASKHPFVLIELSGDRVPEIERHGLLYVLGDATEESVLQEANLAQARALVITVPSDSDSVFITLTARELAPKVQILARAEYPSTQKKLHQAGADHVVLPSAIGAHRLTSLLTNPSAVEFIELVTQRSSLAIEMEEFPLIPTSLLTNQSLRDADVGRRTGVIVIAVKRADGRVEFPPSGDEPFAAGDSIVLVGRRTNLDQFRLHFCGLPRDAKVPRDSR